MTWWGNGAQAPLLHHRFKGFWPFHQTMGATTLAQDSTTTYPREEESSMLPGMRILVVEDDSKIASFIVNGLKQSGFAVDHANDGEDGLFRAQTITYDAAVVDLMLPKLDGLGLIQQLRAAG